MVQVKVNEGVLEGEKLDNEYGDQYYSFKGIPYAQPHIGHLRFKPPHPLQPWSGVRKAKKFGPVCYQYNFMYPHMENMDEDCLHLNVYTPDINHENRLPVMVWIHGGGYIWGSGNDDFYGPQFIIRHNVILVTFNYRLEALGFLCLDTADVPGNAGMKDQVAALRWVKKNIRNFGGDPDNITIFGESAGAGSVSYHLISPMSKGLFRRAIAQSGAATCWWAQEFQPRETALLLAKQLGCFSEDDKVVYDFFQKQPRELLVKLKLKISKVQKSYEIYFAIANEKDFGQERFFYGDVTDALRNGIHEGVEIITGYTQDEGLMALVVGDPLETMITEAKYYNEFFIPKHIKTHCIIGDQFKVGRKMREFYMKHSHSSKDAVLKFLSTDMFVYGVMLSGICYSKKNKLYLYKFTCQSERNFLGHCFGLKELIQDKAVVCHADDLAYLFPISAVKGKVDEKSETFKLIDRMTKLWTNFAKFGNPTPEQDFEIKWKPYNLHSQEYLDIGNKLTMRTAPDKEELEFWETIFREYLPNYTAEL